MTVSLALFTADLRLRDNPVLRGALAAADETVPLFVLDTGIRDAGFAVPNRRAFLADCLAALDDGLRERGGRLVLREGEVVRETVRLVRECGAREVHVAAGASGYAQRREERLRAALDEQGCALRVHDAVTTVLPPGEVTPSGGRDHFAVFTPYFRQWRAASWRTPVGAPRVVRVPDGVTSARLPRRDAVRHVSPGLEEGGEAVGRARWTAWRRRRLEAYGSGDDDLRDDATSRLSPHLHFGTVSPVELAHDAVRRGDAEGDTGADAFARQLAWRDFHHQVLAARPDASYADYRDRDVNWRQDERACADWRAGRTGVPLVDAGMRQLAYEGWLPNRVRLVAASWLTKTMRVDWRIGAAHFLELLVDGDIADNQLNWQWVAGTGNDTRPNRVLNPERQQRRYDPDGEYVRRWTED